MSTRIVYAGGAFKLDTRREVGFNLYVKGDDWRGTERARRLEARFAEVMYFPYTVHTSNTVLRLALPKWFREISRIPR